MKKRFVFIALLLCAAVLLCACAPKDNTGGENDNQGQNSPIDPSAVNASANNDLSDLGLPDGYDPASEEGGAEFNPNAAYDEFGNQIYAGATPIPIDPIDMPTATPRPELTFSYGEYVASKLGIKFNSAVGYEVNESANNIYILTEPATAVKDNYPCVITLEISPITTSYNTNDVRKDLSSYLKTLEGQYDRDWETWQAASRKLMGGQGYYNNYRGEMSDGTVVRGRVHMAKIGDNQLLTLHISCPGWYNSSYMKIYDAIRDSIKPIN